MKSQISQATAIAMTVSLLGAGCFSSADTTQAPIAPPQEESVTDAAVTSTANAAPASATSTPTEAVAPTPTPAPIPTPKPKAPPTAKPTVKTVVVTMTDGKYSPQIIAVSAGDTVMWVNKDTLPHTTKSDGALLWDSGTVRPGGTFKRVFSQPGSYTYSCGIHPHMKGTVIVK